MPDFSAREAVLDFMNRLEPRKSSSMKTIVFLGICAIAQVAWVHGATRAQKALMTPLSLDAAQVRSMALSNVMCCSESPGPKLVALTGGSSGRFQELYRVIWQEVQLWCGASEAPSNLRPKCEIYSCAQQPGRHIQGERTSCEVGMPLAE